MPSLRRTSDSDLVTIELVHEPNTWVKVKRKLGKPDERAIRRATLNVASVAGATAGDNVFEQMPLGDALEVATFATLEVAIREWCFDDPLTPENIRALEDDDVEAIKVALNELYPAPLTEEEAGNSAGSGAQPSKLPVKADAQPSLSALAG